VIIDEVFCRKTNWHRRTSFTLGNGLLRLLTLTGGGHVADVRLEDSTGVVVPFWSWERLGKRLCLSGFELNRTESTGPEFLGRPYNPKVAGPNPAPATKLIDTRGAFRSRGKPFLILGKTWERNHFPLSTFWPIRPEQFPEFLCCLALVLGERVRVALRHTSTAVPESPLANLVRDAHRRIGG